MYIASQLLPYHRVALARRGFIGKIHLTSLMNEKQTKAEMRSVFSTAMKEDPQLSGFTFCTQLEGEARP